MPQFKLVYYASGDWVELWIDGHIARFGHELDTDDVIGLVLHHLGMPSEQLEVVYNHEEDEVERGTEV